MSSPMQPLLERSNKDILVGTMCHCLIRKGNLGHEVTEEQAQLVYKLREEHPRGKSDSVFLKLTLACLEPDNRAILTGITLKYVFRGTLAGGLNLKHSSRWLERVEKSCKALQVFFSRKRHVPTEFTSKTLGELADIIATKAGIGE